jgi:hypothetical protein
LEAKVERGRLRFILTLQPLSYVDNPIKTLRAALKWLRRQAGMQCVGISTTDDFFTPTQRSVPMHDNELEFLRRYVSVARSHSGFGVSFLKCDGNSGQWKAGKDRTDMNGRRLVADVPDAMHGWQKFESNKPIYVIGRICHGYQPPERDTLGDTDRNRWHGGKDPWHPVVLLPMYDPETREPFLFTSTNDGGKDAVTALIDAVVDNVALHADDTNKLPVCGLASNSYLNSHGKEIFVPIFEIMNWTERPEAVRRIKPTPIEMLAIESNVVSEESKSAASPSKRKPQQVAAGGGGGGGIIDDEIPFAPCR